MKRVNSEWWTGPGGYYKQISKGVFEGPFLNMQEDPATGEDSTVIDSGPVTVKPTNSDE